MLFNEHALLPWYRKRDETLDKYIDRGHLNDINRFAIAWAHHKNLLNQHTLQYYSYYFYVYVFYLLLK